MSNLSGLPPSAIAHAASLAVTQDIGVRLINLPESLQSNSQSLSLKGTVLSQNSDGSLKVETDRGVVTVLLKDRGTLSAGQQIEIEIPAGSPPQTAALRQPPTQTQPLIQAPISIPAGQLPSPALANPYTAALRVDRGSTINPNDIAEALASSSSEILAIPTAPLQTGQILRLIPLTNLLQSGQTSVSAPILNPEQLFTALVNTITQTPDIPEETKQNLIQILKQIDPASLLPSPSSNIQPTSQEAIDSAFQKLTQTLDPPQSIKLPNAPLQKYPTYPIYAFHQPE